MSKWCFCVPVCWELVLWCHLWCHFCEVIFVMSFFCKKWSWKLKRRLLWGFWYLARDPKLWRWLEVAEAVLKLSVDTELPTLSSKWFQAAIIRGQRRLLIVLWYTLGTTVWNLQRNDGLTCRLNIPVPVWWLWSWDDTWQEHGLYFSSSSSSSGSYGNPCTGRKSTKLGWCAWILEGAGTPKLTHLLVVGPPDWTLNLGVLNV